MLFISKLRRHQWEIYGVVKEIKTRLIVAAALRLACHRYQLSVHTAAKWSLMLVLCNLIPSKLIRRKSYYLPSHPCSAIHVLLSIGYIRYIVRALLNHTANSRAFSIESMKDSVPQRSIMPPCWRALNIALDSMQKMIRVGSM